MYFSIAENDISQNVEIVKIVSAIAFYINLEKKQTFEQYSF